MMKNKDIECYQLFPKELVINTDFIMIFRIILTGFVLLSLTGVASAADYYVSNYGNNSGDGLSIENSWATPSYAAQQVIAGDTIYLINGTWYNDHVVFSNSGNATHPITLTSYTGTPTLDGVDKTGVGIKLNGQNYITINGLKVTQYMQTIAADASHDVNITNCDLSNTSGSLIILSIGGAHNNLLEGNTMYDSGWNTVQLSGSREPPNGNGIPATNITVRNNVIYNSNVHSSIDIFGNVENITIEGNLFYNSTDGDIYFHSTTDTAKTVLIHNNTWNATGMQKNLISFPDAGSSLYLHENITITNNIFRNTKSTVKAIHIGHVDSLYAAYNNYYNVAIPSETLSGTDVIFYKNYIDDDSGSHISLYGSSAITVRNPIGKHSIQPHSGGVATLEYDNNQVFVGSAGGSYASFVPTAYYPTHSNSTVVANSGNQAWLHSTLYQMSMTPSTNTSSMRINKFNTSEIVNNVAVNFTANSTDGTKVDFLIWDLLSNHHYLIKKDGTNFTTTQANSTGYIQFSNSEWSEHTFTIEETSHAVVIDVESDTPVSITPSTQTVAPNQPFTLTIPITPATPITGAQFDLLFDNSLATVTTVTEGNLLNQDGATTLFNSGTINNAAGTVTNTYGSILGETSVSSQGSFATISMTAGSTTGYLNLDLTNVKISDADSAAAPYTLTNATVLIDTAPVLTQIGAKSVDEGSALIFTTSASDADGDSLTYSASGLPAGASFNTATGAFSWTPADGQDGIHVVTFEVTDGYLTDSETVIITVNDANHAPVITTFVPANSLTYNESDVITVGIIATDADGQALSYTIKIDGVTQSTSSSYVWETDYSSAGTHTIDITVSDGIVQVTDQRTITINDVHPRWDVNEDGTVNVLDISTIGQKYGKSVGAPYPRWDVNQDGDVNVQDMTLAAYHFGETVV